MNYLVSWSVFVLDADDPIDAARKAREMCDDHGRSMWGVEECESGDTYSVDLTDGVIVETEDLEDDMEFTP